MEAADTPDSFLTVAEVAATLKLNQQTVRNWIDQGSFPEVRIGRRVRIRRSDFERILAESYTGVSPSDSETQGPTAEDFWGGEALGVAAAINDPAAGNDAQAGARGPGIGFCVLFYWGLASLRFILI